MFCLFRGGVDKLGDACQGRGAMPYLLLDGIVNIICGEQSRALVVEDQGRAIIGSGLGLKWGDARHPLFD